MWMGKKKNRQLLNHCAIFIDEISSNQAVMCESAARLLNKHQEKGHSEWWNLYFISVCDIHSKRAYIWFENDKKMSLCIYANEMTITNDESTVSV